MCEGGEVKKILLLGGSAQQVIAIKKAKKLGLYTVLIDYLPDNPGQFVADKYYPESTTDIEGVYRIAKDENVSGILAYASDPAALPCAVVCERLGLPTNPAESVKILGIKNVFRKFLFENGFSCPKFVSFSLNDFFNISNEKKKISESISAFQFPVVIKPTDSSGSKGVSKINSLEELEKGGIEKAVEYAKDYSRNNILICEEFIQRGFEYVVGGDIFVWNGKVVLYGEMSCLRDDGGKGLIPIGKKKPSGLNSIQIEKVHLELQRLVTALNIKFGELNIEIILDKNDGVHFLELGPRAGGNMIPIQLSDAFGVDLVKANILAAMGENPEIIPSDKKNAFMTYVLHSKNDGIFNGIEIAKEIEPFVYRKVVYKKTGDNVFKFDGAGKACGIVFLRFEDENQMNAFAKNIEEMITVNLVRKFDGGGYTCRVKFLQTKSCGLPVWRVA